MYSVPNPNPSSPAHLCCPQVAGLHGCAHKALHFHMFSLLPQYTCYYRAATVLRMCQHFRAQTCPWSFFRTFTTRHPCVAAPGSSPARPMTEAVFSRSIGCHCFLAPSPWSHRAEKQKRRLGSASRAIAPSTNSPALLAARPLLPSLSPCRYLEHRTLRDTHCARQQNRADHRPSRAA